MKKFITNSVIAACIIFCISSFNPVKLSLQSLQNNSLSQELYIADDDMPVLKPKNFWILI